MTLTYVTRRQWKAFVVSKIHTWTQWKHFVLREDGVCHKGVSHVTKGVTWKVFVLTGICIYYKEVGNGRPLVLQGECCK